MKNEIIREAIISLRQEGLKFSIDTLPKSAFDLESPYFMPFSVVSTPKKAFSIVSKSVGT